ncbi:phage terminase small subunit P27 family [Fructilactobacillus sp. Tb1]|uniref:phage terminase small subunit P27 family n=1 Tax=Fructilactobacillus sp. Tb1 TaxID=3422304 RepID=UPI003D283C5C
MSNDVQKNIKLKKRPPYYLKSYAASMWRRIIPILQEQYDYKKVDQTQIEMFCIQYEILRKLYDSIEDDGVINRVEKSVQANGSGKIIGKDFVGFKQNDAVKALNSTITTLNKLSDNIGLTIASRNSLLNVDNEEKTENKTEALAKIFKPSFVKDKEVSK